MSGRRRLPRRLPAAVAATASFVSVLTFGLTPVAAQSPGTEGTVVEITPPSVDVQLGQSVEVAVSVTNQGSTPTEPLAVHLDITDPSESGSVDPEDWTPTLTQQAGVVEPGATVTLNWVLQPISGGNFSVYAVALSPADRHIHATAEAIDFAVIHQRTLNPVGVLPIALAMPIAIGGVLLVQWRRPRLRRQPSTA